ncbi:hypothetical protein H920_19669 [Fukomys damarensis]|uniref:Uncharacterized protein n=1 Tax=Fukomys damarensis TaxID=885580 RepID=A0A091CP30_FUKDA|nr:hypothetical protein H920_19669 [Fukomys damarensis]
MLVTSGCCSPHVWVVLSPVKYAKDQGVRSTDLEESLVPSSSEAQPRATDCDGIEKEGRATANWITDVVMAMLLQFYLWDWNQE